MMREIKLFVLYNDGTNTVTFEFIIAVSVNNLMKQ